MGAARRGGVVRAVEEKGREQGTRHGRRRHVPVEDSTSTVERVLRRRPAHRLPSNSRRRAGRMEEEAPNLGQEVTGSGARASSAAGARVRSGVPGHPEKNWTSAGRLSVCAQAGTPHAVKSREN